MAHHMHEQVHANVAREPEPQRTIVSVVVVTAQPSNGGSATLNANAAQQTAGPDFFDAGSDSGSGSGSSAGPDFFDAGSGSTTAAASARVPSSGPIFIQPSAASPSVAQTSQAPAVVAQQPSSSIAQATFGLHNGPPAGALMSTTLATVASIASSAALSPSSNPSSSSSSSDSSSSSNYNDQTQSKSAPTASSTPSESGMSSGGKAGLAFGIIVLIALVVGAAFFFYRKRRADKEGHLKLEDEKNGFSHHQPSSSIASHVSVRRKNNQAPRLSLRPVTEMFPDMAQNQPRSNNGMLAAGAAHNRGPSPSPAANPFDDPANSYNERNGPGPIDMSPAPDAIPMSTVATPVEAKRQSPPGGAAQMNVHRVQMDFAPSMEDELELKAGQLVRLIHEYDDGWALCKRLDRSQQGVVPRTCLSRVPVKPRPAGPAPPHMRGPPPNGRPMQGPPPAGMNGRPMGPPGAGRPRAPSNAPAPLNPANRSRANSTSTAGKRMTPPSGASSDPSSPNSMPPRKPVPGQAL